jgi:molybdenum cofactor cytidylyltransferase
MSVALIVLAAGNSSRMGSSKQLLKFKGESLVTRAIQAGMGAGCSPVIVVLGHNAEHVKAEIESLPAIIAMNPQWESGMGTSIRVGIEALEKIPDATAALITLCDQPRVNASVLARLLTAQSEHNSSIIAAYYGGAPGVPAIFPRSFFGALKQLAPGGGAKSLLLKYAPQVIAVPMEEAAVDIDTPEDFQNAV